MKRVGFIGLGLMGGPMAANILRAGYPLTVFNRTASKAAPHVELGATTAKDPAEVAQRSEVVITMLADADSVRDMLSGERGMLAGAHEPKVLIDMSTVSPAQARQLSADVLETGWQMLDAPVFGSTGPAAEGTLGIMVGGPQELYEQQHDLLATMGAHIFYMGPSGSGALVKLCFNLMVAAQVTSLAEAMALASKGGLELDKVAEVITASGISSNLIARKMMNIVLNDFTPAFPLRHMNKDLGLMIDTARGLEVGLPSTAVIHQLFNAARAQGHADEDFSAIFRLIAGMAGIVS